MRRSFETRGPQSESSLRTTLQVRFERRRAIYSALSRHSAGDMQVMNKVHIVGWWLIDVRR